MLAITHAAIAAAGTSLILGTGQPLPLGLAILGSQLPDLDTTTSTISKIFFPISSCIENRFPHRSITHSLLATAGIAAVSLGVNYFLHGDIKTAIALLCLGIYLANGGRITQKVSQNLGLRDGIVRVYNENASTNKVYVEI